MQHLSAEEIAAYLDGETSDTEFRTAQQHLSSCAECKQHADEQNFVRTLMGSLGEPELPRSFAITPEMVEPAAPLVSPASPTQSERPGGTILRFEVFTKYLSVAAVIAFLVLGGAQLAGFGDTPDTNSNGSIELTETGVGDGALQVQEPTLSRGEVREQGESAAVNAAPLTTNTNVDTHTQATENGLTPIEITTIGVGIVALASISGWILIHYRAGTSSSNA